MYENLPKDPIILLSFINTRLRDHYKSLDELADALPVDVQELTDTLGAIDYEYDPAVNQFV